MDAICSNYIIFLIKHDQYLFIQVFIQHNFNRFLDYSVSYIDIYNVPMFTFQNIIIN